MPYLVLLGEDKTPRTVEIRGTPVTLGSKADNTLVVRHPGVSRHHARLVLEGTGYVIEDLESTNFVFVDNQRIQRRELKSGTTFSLGLEAHFLYLDAPDDERLKSFVERHRPRPAQSSESETRILEAIPRRDLQNLKNFFEFGAAINSSLELGVVLENIVDRAMAITEAHRGCLMLLEEQTLVPRIIRNRKHGGSEPFMHSESLPRQVMESGQTLTYNAGAPGSMPRSPSVEDQGITSLLCSPLKIGSNFIGCLYVDVLAGDRTFSNEDASLFTALAGQAAMAINNSQLAEDLKSRLVESEGLYELSRRVTMNEDLDTVLVQCLDKARELLGAERTSMMMFEPRIGRLRVRHVSGAPMVDEAPILLQLGEGVAGRVALENKGLIVNGTTADPRFQKVLDRDSGTRQIMCAPMISRARCIGVINVVNRVKPGDFGQQHLNLLSSIANLAALCIENHQSLQARIEQVRLDQELEDIMKLETLMRPAEAPPTLSAAKARYKDAGGDMGRNLYEQLQRDYAQLQQLEQLRKNMTDMIVHDLRSPLSAMSGLLELLDMEVGKGLPATPQRWLKQVRRNTGRMAEMVNSLLDISRFEEGRMQLHMGWCSMDELIQQSLSTLEGTYRDGQIVVKPLASPAALECDVNLIRRVVMNLLSNAIKFSPLDQGIELELFDQGDEIELQVRDRGPGIPPEYHQKIFEKFGQVEGYQDPKVPSSGLGLTFCKLALEAHGGSIGVRSAMGHGSQFWIRLPKRRPNVESSTPE